MLRQSLSRMQPDQPESFVAPDLARITERLKKSREVIERDMDDSATKINAAELLERIEALRLRIEASRSAFGSGFSTDHHAGK